MSHFSELSGQVVPLKKAIFNGKHKLFGYKLEVAVIPNGLVVSSSEHYLGSGSDFEVLQRRKEWHIENLRKRENEKSIIDFGENFELFEEIWAVLCDMDYRKIKELMQGIHPEKKPVNDTLYDTKEVYNKKISSNRITFDNFLG